MTIESALSLAIGVLILAATPGPGVLTSVAHALSNGFRSSLFVIAGIVMGDLLFLLLAVLGLSAVAHALGGLFFMVKLVGGGYLVWLGCRLWMRTPEPKKTPRDPFTPERSRSFLTGLLVTLGNPKVILFYAGFLPNFLDLTQLNLTDITILSGIVAGVLGCVLSIYTLGATKARRLISSRQTTRNINRATGTIMIGAGTFMVAR